MKQTMRRAWAFMAMAAIALAFSLYSPSPPGYGKQGYGQTNVIAYNFDATPTADALSPATKLDLAGAAARVDTSYPAPQLRAAATELDGLVNTIDMNKLLTALPTPHSERLRSETTLSLNMHIDTSNHGKHLGLGASDLGGRSPTASRVEFDLT